MKLNLNSLEDIKIVPWMWSSAFYKVSIIKRLFSFIFTYMVLFGAKFKVLDLTVLFALLLAFYYFIYILYKRVIIWQVAFLSLYIALITSFFVFISVLSQNSYIVILGDFLKLIFYLFTAAGLVHLYRNLYSKRFEEFIIKDVFFSILLTAVLVLVLFLFPEFRNSLYSELDLYIFKGRPPEIINNRIIDLSIGGSTLSMILYFSLFFLMESGYRVNRFKLKTKVFRTIVFFLILVATMLVARTGFILFIVTSILYGLSKFLKRPSSIISYFLIGIFSLLCVSIIGIVIIRDSVISNFLHHVAPWAFEYFYSYAQKGDFSTESGRYLAEQYIVPDDYSSLFFGGGSYDILSDSSFIKLISSVGIVGLLFAIFIFVFPVLGAQIYKKSLSYKYMLIYLGIIFLGNIKETMLGNSRGAIIIFFIFFILAIKVGMNRKKQFSG